MQSEASLVAMVNMDVNKFALGSVLNIYLAYFIKLRRYAYELGVSWIGVSPEALKYSIINGFKG